MTKFSVEFEGNAIVEAQRLLGKIPGGMQTAVARAVNRALSGARTTVVKAVRERYTVKSKDVRQSLRFKKATKNSLDGELISEGSQLELSHFKVKPRTDTTGNRQRKVIAEIIKGSANEVKRGFIYNTQVFRREGRSRLPINKQTGPAVPQMLGQDEVLNKAMETLQKRFASRLQHETEALINKWSRR